MEEFVIGICDDIEKDREEIRLFCEKFLKEKEVKYSFVLFSSGEEILSYKGKRLHLLFLDIEMEKIDGIQVLRTLEHSKFVWRVVFVTSHQESVFDAFGIRTLGFERKPVVYEQIQKWLKVLIQEYRDNIVIEYTGVDGKQWVEIENLYYIEAQRNYVILHIKEDTKEKEILASGNLKSWEKKLEGTYVIRIHKTYLINLIYVSAIGKEILLKNGRKISIGRQYKETVSKKYHEYICKMITFRNFNE